MSCIFPEEQDDDLESEIVPDGKKTPGPFIEQVIPCPRDAKHTVQFNFSGQVAGECYFLIENGNFKTGLGNIDHPDLIIESPFEVWMDILTKKADGQKMFMERKYTIKGDIAALLRIREFLGN